MRLRSERRARKQLRRMRRGIYSNLPASVAKLERRGVGFAEALRTILMDAGVPQFVRGTAGRLLSLDGSDVAVRALLELFFSRCEKDEVYLTALALEELNDRRAVPPLIRALLKDSNPHRRHAAARALGWMLPGDRAAARALAACLADPAQPEAAREEAAESLAYVGTRETIPALVAALGDSDVRIRFWAAFGLGGSGRGDARAVRALEGVLGDLEVPPGNWWAVGLEALAALRGTAFDAEIRRIGADPGATAEERRWVECYGPPAKLP